MLFSFSHSISPSLFLSLASCQSLIVFWCSCRLVMVPLPFQAQTQWRVVHSHTHTHTHTHTQTQLSLQIYIKPAVTSQTRKNACSFAYIHILFPYCLVIICPTDFRSVSSFFIFSTTPDIIDSPNAHTVSQCLCQMQWCQMRSLHVKCVHVFSDSPAPLALTPPRTAVEVNICTQSWTVEGFLWPTSPCCIKY